MVRGSLALVGLMLLGASVASGSGLVIAASHTATAGWIRYGHMLSGVGVVGPTSEPMRLLVLGCGFVLVSYRLRRKC